MQNAKDTFFETLRARLAALNPARTVVIRNSVRPAILVESNELVSDADLLDCFRLRWTGDELDAAHALPLITAHCEISYSTRGNALNAGMDRGRMLSTLDAELAAIVNTAPQRARKHDYARHQDLSTNLWWSNITWDNVTERDGKLARTAHVAVMSYAEGGER